MSFAGPPLAQQAVIYRKHCGKGMIAGEKI
jgi:hypothetical protein